jgi:site-specific DNA-methyltransferase (adenine-specific)
MQTNYIKCCDNVEGLRGLPDNCIDLTVTSPPYDDLRTYKGFSWDFDALAVELYRVTKPGGVIVWVVNDATVKGSETGTSFRQALAFKELGFNLHDTMIWKKRGLSFPDRIRYYPAFEYMFIVSKGKPKAINLIADRKNKHAGEAVTANERLRDGSLVPSTGKLKGRRIKPYGVRFNVWEQAAAMGNKTGHPAVFPVQLAADHIISWSNPGDVVLDPFMGSGTTAVACIKTGRKYIGFECSAEYCEKARERIEKE